MDSHRAGQAANHGTRTDTGFGPSDDRVGGGGPHAHAVGGSVVPKRRRPPQPCGGGLGGPKAEEAPTPMRRGPRWYQSVGTPLAHAAGPQWSLRGRGPHAHAAGPGWSASWMKLNPLRGVPIPQVVQAGPEGRGCIRRYVGGAGKLCAPGAPTGRPYPPSGPGRTGGTRVYLLLFGRGWIVCIPGSPTGRPDPPSG